MRLQMTKVDLEQLALTWFQDSGWGYRHGPVVSADGGVSVLDKVLGAIKADNKDGE